MIKLKGKLVGEYNYNYKYKKTKVTHRIKEFYNEKVIIRDFNSTACLWNARAGCTGPGQPITERDPRRDR